MHCFSTFLIYYGLFLVENSYFFSVLVYYMYTVSEMKIKWLTVDRDMTLSYFLILSYSIIAVIMLPRLGSISTEPYHFHFNVLVVMYRIPSPIFINL